MDKEKVIKWLEYDYFPRIGAYRKDCKQGCDACMPMHDGDDYCDIDMLCKILALLKEQEPKTVESIQISRNFGAELTGYCPSCSRPLKNQFNNRFCGNCGQEVNWDENRRMGK